MPNNGLLGFPRRTPSSSSDTGGGGMAVTVAASDSTIKAKANADFVCDGINDEVEIEAAIAILDAQTGGDGDVLLAGGEYVIDASINTGGSSDRLRILGEGPCDGVLFSYPATYMRRTTDNPMWVMNGSQVEFANIYCEDDNAGSPTTSLVSPGGACRVTFRDCLLYDFNGTGALITPGTSDRVHLIRCDIEGNGACVGGSGISNIRVIASDTYLYSDTTFCLDLTALGNSCEITLRDCINDGAGGGYRIDGDPGSTPMPRVEIVGGECFGNTNEDIYITDCLFLRLEGVKVGRGEQHSVRLSNVDGGIISRLELGDATAGCDKHGIWALDCDLLTIEDNQIFNVGAATAATYSGIILDGDTNDCLVQGNKVWSDGAGNRALYGIRVNSSTCDNNMVIDNDLRSSSTTVGDEFSDAGTGTVAGLEPTLLTGWYQDNVAVSQSAVVLSLPLAGRSEITVPVDYYVIGIDVQSNAARSAGTLTVEATINGTGTGLTAVLDGTNTIHKATRQSNSADKGAGGSRVGVKITTDGSWAPTTADIDVSVLIVCNTANRI